MIESKQQRMERLISYISNASDILEAIEKEGSSREYKGAINILHKWGFLWFEKGDKNGTGTQSGAKQGARD